MTQPDKEHWRDIYESEFQAGRNRQEYVLEVFSKWFPKEKFPNLKIKETGFGAETAERIELREHERGEPDKTVYYKGKVICYIEVSGSDIEMRPNDYIWIRPDKFKHAKQVKEETWFYNVYTNGDFILDVNTITPFENDVRTRYPKRKCLECGAIFRPTNKCPKCSSFNITRIPEDYIHIPSQKAYPRNRLFEWIRNKLSKAN